MILAFNQTNAQESKAYLGVSLGVAFPGGDGADALKGAGLNLGLINFGYRFTESWGATLNLTSSGFAYDDYDGAAFGVGVFSVGPMYTANLGETISLDLKPQYALSMVGKTSGFGDEDNATYKGNGIVRKIGDDITVVVESFGDVSSKDLKAIADAVKEKK